MSDAAAPSPTYALDDTIAVVTLDDGKANAISHSLIEATHRHLDRAEQEAAAVLIVGRPGRFSAGFDLSVMTGSQEGVRDLVTAGAELLLRLYEFPLPTVAACTGHAVAAGALILLSVDQRVGADVDAKIGLTEVSIGMTLPIFGVELARQRLASPREFERATLGAQLYDPSAAAEVGFLDRVVPAEHLHEKAVDDARSLAALDRAAYRATKVRARGPMIDYVRSTLEADLGRLTGPRQVTVPQS